MAKKAYTLTDKRETAALKYVNKFRDNQYSGKAARPVTRLRKVPVGESVIARTINFAHPEQVDLSNAPSYIVALDEAHARGEIETLIAAA